MGSSLTLRILEKGRDTGNEWKEQWRKGGQGNGWKDVRVKFGSKKIERIQYGKVSGGGTFAVNECKLGEGYGALEIMSEEREIEVEEIKLETTDCKSWIFSKKCS